MTNCLMKRVWELLVSPVVLQRWRLSSYFFRLKFLLVISFITSWINGIHRTHARSQNKTVDIGSFVSLLLVVYCWKSSFCPSKCHGASLDLTLRLGWHHIVTHRQGWGHVYVYYTRVTSHGWMRVTYVLEGVVTCRKGSHHMFMFVWRWHHMYMRMA